MEKIKIGIIGFGNIGTMHCNNLKEGRVIDIFME